MKFFELKRVKVIPGAPSILFVNSGSLIKSFTLEKAKKWA